MADDTARVDIPDRALFKGVEVCDIVKVQPYVLRSWEAEFPDLGVAKKDGGARIYRRSDVEQVVRIKHLLLVEGLTLAGARRKLQDEGALVAPDAPGIDELLGQNARERLTAVKRGLRSILDLLSAGPADAFELAPPAPTPTLRAWPAPPIGAKAEQGGDAVSGAASKPSASSRRKRSA